MEEQFDVLNLIIGYQVILNFTDYFCQSFMVWDYEDINETYNIAKYCADKNNGTVYEVKVKDVWLPSMPGEYDRMSLNCEWWLRDNGYIKI